jgi:large repetitive protein
VSGVVGYNVYRRTAAGSYDFASPLNGATPLTGVTYADVTAVNATTYFYTVRSVITGAGGAQVESVNSAESAAVTADGLAPPAPTAVSVTSGGNVTSATLCSIAAGTRYINDAGKAAVGVTATIAAPETGEAVVFSATTAGSTPVTATVAAAGTSVSATLDLGSLLDGTLTLTARTLDVAGNLSATTAPTNVLIKDVVAGALSGVSYNEGGLFAADQIKGTSECGATIVAVQTAPSSATFTSAPVGAAGTFTLNVAALAVLTAYSYNVTATDLAGNTSAIVARQAEPLAAAGAGTVGLCDSVNHA